MNLCTPIESFANGKVTVTGLTAGDKSLFTCNPGHRLEGPDEVTCELGGNWSDDLPVCNYIDCGRPSTVDNGVSRLLNGTTTFRSALEYQCAEDYWLVGAKHRYCQENGYWSDEDPYCQSE